MTRRELIWRAAQGGGLGAAFVTMRALDLLGAPPQDDAPFTLPAGAGRGASVVVLGAGIAGLVAAYELRKAGFACTVLEARKRPGGRNWTIRGGDEVRFTDGFVQRCGFGEGQYFNAGPGRIPSIHRTILGYCKELGVPMQVEVNSSRSALLQSDRVFLGRPVEQRQAINDSRGYVAELLAKAIRRGALDEEVSREDRERLLAFLISFGDLRQDYVYRGSSRAGLKRYPGAGDAAEERRDPLPLGALLEANFWRGLMQEEGLTYQATMLEPVGGMDRIPHAFARKLGGTVKYECPVKELRKTATGVRVVYANRGRIQSLEADYCICTLPVPALRDVAHDLSPAVAAAVRQVAYANAYKIAWESRRFWEQENNIYGGISWLASGPISMEASVLGNLWYPSYGFLAETGVLVAGYGTETGAFGALPTVEAKLEASRAAVERLHPGRSRELTKPLYVAWAKVPYSLGSWVRGDSLFQDAYRQFLEPDGRIYFAGDHCSQLTTWQEGAALASQRAVRMIAERVRSSTGFSPVP